MAKEKVKEKSNALVKVKNTEVKKEEKRLISVPSKESLAIRAISNTGPTGQKIGTALKTINFVSKLKEEKKKWVKEKVEIELKL